MLGLTSRERLALLAIFVLAALLRFSFWSELRGTSLDQWQRFDQSDMATYVEQARRIQAGDLLQAEPYHPYHSWQTVAPPEKWLAWYGAHSFHQAPAYSYALAAVQPIAGLDFALIKALQLLLGAGTCVLLFLIAHHLCGFAAAVAAGSFAAFYGPLMFLEAQLLREGPALFWILAIVYALMKLLAREEITTQRLVITCACLGAAVGAFAMFHEMGSVLMLVLLISLLLGQARTSWRNAAIAVACAGAGWLGGFAPLLARNVAVGAAPFSVSCRTVINFVESNVADAPDRGATFAPPGPTVVRVLDEAKGSGLAALAGVWKTYDGDLGRALANLSTKFSANWLAFEIPDNTSFDFFREHAPVLRFTPTFSVLFPLGLAGVIAIAWEGLRRKRALAAPTKQERKRARRQGEDPVESKSLAGKNLTGHLVLALLFVALTAALSLVHTVARFRMYLVPMFIIYAAIFLAHLWQSLRERRFGHASVLALTAVAGVFLQQSIPSDTFSRGFRWVDYAVAAKLAVERHEFDAVQKYCDEARPKFPGDGSVPAMAGMELEHAGQRDLAIECYRRALQIDPNTQIAREGLQRLKAN